jgi:formylmethanofuran dehydrogenase subunit D
VSDLLDEPEFLLLTGRTVYQGVEKEKGKFTPGYQEYVAICEIDPDDMERLNIKESSRIKVTTDFGEIVVRAVKSLRAPHAKIIFMPYGPWASIIMGAGTDGTGMPTLKGIPASLTSAPNEKILKVTELLEQFYHKYASYTR